jgi:hypothetical protein
VHEGSTGHAVLERRDGVVVGRAGKFHAALGEASNVLAEALSRLLLAVAHLLLLAGARVLALEVPDEDSTQVGPVVDLVTWQVLEPCPHGVAEVEWQVLDDGEVVCLSPCVTCESVVLEPYAGVGVPVVPGYVGRSSEM